MMAESFVSSKDPRGKDLQTQTGMMQTKTGASQNDTKIITKFFDVSLMFNVYVQNIVFHFIENSHLVGVNKT